MNPELGDIETVEKTGIVSLHEVLHDSGLTFVDKWKMPIVASGPGGGMVYGTKRSGKPLRCFGALLDKPMYTDAESLRSAMLKDADSVTPHAVYRTGPSGEMKEMDGWKVLVSDKTHKEYSIVSDQYYAIQDKDIFLPIIEIAEQTGLKVIGSMYGVGTGVTTAYFTFADPKYKVPLLYEHDDYMMAGITVRNSYGMDKSAYVEANGIRMICTNYCLWGDELGRYSYKHFEVNADKIQRMTQDLCEEIIDKSPKLRDFVAGAASIPVQHAQIKDLGWALDIPMAVAYEVYQRPSMFEQTIKTQGLTKWTVYNAFSAALTHKDNRILNLVKVDESIKKCKRLLYEDVDKLCKEGFEKREAFIKSVTDAMTKKGIPKEQMKIDELVKL
jgi:hypothetical protein